MLRILRQPGGGLQFGIFAGVVPQVVEQDDPASAAEEARERIVQALRPELAREIPGHGLPQFSAGDVQ